MYYILFMFFLFVSRLDIEDLGMFNDEKDEEVDEDEEEGSEDDDGDDDVDDNIDDGEKEDKNTNMTKIKSCIGKCNCHRNSYFVLAHFLAS